MKHFAFGDKNNKDKKWNVPFHCEVPEFPIPSSNNNLSEIGKNEDNIPSHLPAFPPEHLYKRTLSDVNKRSKNDNTTTEESNKRQKRSSVTATAAIQQSLTKIEDAELPHIVINEKESTAKEEIEIKPLIVSHYREPDDNFNINLVSKETIRELTKEQKMLLGMNEDS